MFKTFVLALLSLNPLILIAAALATAVPFGVIHLLQARNGDAIVGKLETDCHHKHGTLVMTGQKGYTCINNNSIIRVSIIQATESAP